MRSYWLIFAGTVVGAFTLFAAIAAALYAREAAKHTETGAIQAERSAKAAECQSARNWDPGSARKRDPFFEAQMVSARRAELVRVAQPGECGSALWGDQARFLKRQDSFPVSMISQ